MIIKDALGHMYDNNTGMDFVEEYLNAEWSFKEM